VELAAHDRRATFERDGYLGPVGLFAPAQCRRVADYLARSDLPEPAAWSKGRAVHERYLFDLATQPAILGPVVDLLGDDVVLWGVSAVRRKPGDVHPWHSDIESSAQSGFVSVWIGLEHTSRDSSLQLIRGSHRSGTSVQEARAANGVARDHATPQTVLQLVRGWEPDAELVEPEMTDGEGIFFDGRLWHGTDNRRRSGDRLALVLQFARAGLPVRIPDWSELDWPFRLRDEPRPPVIVVRGTNCGGSNAVVPPPPLPPAEAPPLTTAAHAFDLPLEDPEPEKPWLPFPAFRGPTRTCADMSCHASVLAGDHSPHPPHAHVEEELLIPLHGEVEIVIPNSPFDAEPRTERLRPGSFVYYPAWQHHTIRNPGAPSVAYLMFKWRTAEWGTGDELGTEVVRSEDVAPPDGARAFWTRPLLDGPTGCLGKLHAHASVLAPGAGYEPHEDAYDVAIVMLAGRVETLGRQVEPHSVVYCSAGEPHGMRNVGVGPARYLVFELHPPGAS
jgi:mannose-6-phosphate isomerase-like protein (cupin superfamily)